MSHPLRVPFHASGRANSHAFMYFKMCAESLVAYRAITAKGNGLDPMSPTFEDISDRADELSVLPVIFAGMCLEATLYDLAACLFGEEFADRIDKLDPVSKFQVIARYVDRQDPPLGGSTTNAVQAVVSARNLLVHSKSLAFDLNEVGALMKKAGKSHQKKLDGIDNSLKALVLTSLHFDGNIFEELRILPSFKKDEYWVNVVPKELHPEIRWCIEASKKEKSRANA